MLPKPLPGPRRVNYILDLDGRRCHGPVEAKAFDIATNTRKAVRSFVSNCCETRYTSRGVVWPTGAFWFKSDFLGFLNVKGKDRAASASHRQIVPIPFPDYQGSSYLYPPPHPSTMLSCLDLIFFFNVAGERWPHGSLWLKHRPHWAITQPSPVVFSQVYFVLRFLFHFLPISTSSGNRKASIIPRAICQEWYVWEKKCIHMPSLCFAFWVFY